MKNIAICLLAIAWACHAMAQPTYGRLYDTGTAHQLNISELPSHNVLLALGWYRGVSRISPEGYVLQTRSYISDTLSGFVGLRRQAANAYVFAAGYRKDSCMVGMSAIAKWYPALGVMDTVGNVLALKHYMLNDGCSNYPADVAVTADAGILTWGYDQDFFMLRADSALSPLWARRFMGNGGISFLKEFPGGDLLAGINMDTAGAVLARMDAMGNFLWVKSYIRPRGSIRSAVIESDSSFIISGFTDSTRLGPLVPGRHAKLFVMKLDGGGNVQWCKGFDSGPESWFCRGTAAVERTLDGDLAVLATLGVVGQNAAYRPYLMKLNMNGDTIWTRSMGAPNYRYQAWDLLPYSDGGFLLGGWVYGNLPDQNSSMPFLFKTDSLGHFPCVDTHHPVQVMDLFPTDSSFTLSTIDGATIYPAFVSDTTLSSIPEYDACVVATGMVLAYPPRLKPRVYPNPTTGRITVQFADPLTAESYYSVYDTMGRLLHQRPLPRGQQTEEVDLSRYGKGTYVLKFTRPEGVCYERVVLSP